MNAADVLAEALDPDGLMNPDGDYDPLVAALLAHGEQGQGVTIRTDGELVPELPDWHVRIGDEVWLLERTGPGRLKMVPVLDEEDDP